MRKEISLGVWVILLIKSSGSEFTVSLSTFRDTPCSKSSETGVPIMKRGDTGDDLGENELKRGVERW
jgi:hypothetical protein